MAWQHPLAPSAKMLQPYPTKSLHIPTGAFPRSAENLRTILQRPLHVAIVEKVSGLHEGQYPLLSAGFAESSDAGRNGCGPPCPLKRGRSFFAAQAVRVWDFRHSLIFSLGKHRLCLFLSGSVLEPALRLQDWDAKMGSKREICMIFLQILHFSEKTLCRSYVIFMNSEVSS